MNPHDAERIDRLTAENTRLRTAVDALKVVIQHVGKDGKVPMAYVLQAQRALARCPRSTGDQP